MYYFLIILLAFSFYSSPGQASDLTAADTLLKQGRYKKAGLSYRQLLASESTAYERAWATYGLAKSLLLQKEYDAAERYATEARTLLSDPTKALALQGKIALKQGKLTDASNFYIELLAIAPEYRESYLALMEIAERKDDADAVDQWHALYQSRFEQE